jgi:hypothetical protein
VTKNVLKRRMLPDKRLAAERDAKRAEERIAALEEDS